MLDLLFAPRCASCGVAGAALCPVCVRSAGVIVPPLCDRCGRPTEAPVGACGDCPPTSVTACRAPFVYEGPVADAIRALKFRGWGWLARSFAGAMAATAGPLTPEAVTWVPLSRRRRAARGFDQAELLARDVASRLGLPCSGALTRPRDTGAQARRGGRERRSAAASFVARRSVPASVLLVDDVLTTGATAAACADALRGAGAQHVFVLTAARSLGSGVPVRCFEG